MVVAMGNGGPAASPVWSFSPPVTRPPPAANPASPSATPPRTVASYTPTQGGPLDLRSTLLRALLSVPLAAGAVWLAATGGLYVGQRRMLIPTPPPAALPAAPGLTRLDLSVDGAPVPMWWAAVPGAPTVLFFHGNATQLADTVPDATSAMVAGLGFAAVEYPGYGLAPAEEPSEGSCFASGRAAIAALQGLGAGALVCVGHSLGAGVAAAMAAEGRCRALVLAAPFTSVLDMAALQYPWRPTSQLVKDPFDSLGRAALPRDSSLGKGTRSRATP